MRFIFFLTTLVSLKSFAFILVQGQIQKLKAQGQIQIEKNSFFDIKESSDGILIKGKKPGFARLRLNNRIETIQVISLRQEQTRQAILKEIHKTLNLKLEVNEAQILVKGRLTRWKDWLILHEACRPLSCQYLIKAEMDESLKPIANQKINELLINNSLPPQNLTIDKEISAFISDKNFDQKRIENILSSFGIKVVKNKSFIQSLPLIKVVITLAEIRRDELLKYGISWPDSYSAQILPNFEGSNASLTAQALEAQGVAKILASPNLLCRSGKSAEFLAGGEFPIKIINVRMQDVVWKKYGILLKVKPEADFSGRMSISIETEVSSIDPARSVDGIPGLFTNRVQSHFDLLKPQTIALSGLIKSEDHQNTQGWPGLSRIPVLGALFSSKEFKEHRTELIIFVRPQVIFPNEEMGS